MFDHVRFPDSEYVNRLNRVQKLMFDAGLDCLMLTDDRHTWYFTGFGDIGAIGSRARPRILLIPASGAPTFIVHRSTEVTVREMSWFDSILTYTDLKQAPVALIRGVLQEWGCKSLGVELGREQRLGISPQDYFNIVDGLRTEDASELLWAMRAIKSSLEVARIEEACRITSVAYDRGFKRIKVGMTEHQIASVLTEEMAKEGAHTSWIWVITSDYHRTDGVIRDRATERGDLIFVDMGANIGGYWADFSRTAVLGAPTNAQRNTYNSIREVCAIGVELLKPGAHFCDVAEQVHREMKARNLLFNSLADRYGHGLGMAVTEPPNVWDDETTVITTGMVLTMEPGMNQPDGMYHLEENVVITETGNRVLSIAERNLIQI